MWKKKGVDELGELLAEPYDAKFRTAGRSEIKLRGGYKTKNKKKTTN
jgi:hypothetical protein